jgi:hypothetical protein
MAKIILPSRIFGRDVDGAMERVLNGTPNLQQDPDPQPPQTNPANFQNLGDYWRVQVNYRNGICTADLSKSLLDNGNAKTQEQWAEYRKIAEPKGEFYTGDMPLYHAIFTALFKQKDRPESEEARVIIQKQMRKKWLMTLTRIAYQPNGKDKIIHNFGTNQKYELDEKIVGPDRILEFGDGSALTALLGDGNINQIKSIYNWINGTDTYLWRINSKPKSVDERVARFRANSNWASLNCGGLPAVSDASLGVRLASPVGRAGAPKNKQ